MLRRLSLTLAVTAALAAFPATAAAKLTISPAPDTPDASPDTQISVLGVAPGDIDSVVVKGAKSGAHAGKLKRYSGGRGASFVPAQPLTAGEKVAVVVRIHGIKPVRFSFTVATLAPKQPLLNLPQRQPAKLRSFVSEPDLAPPRITAERARLRQHLPDAAALADRAPGLDRDRLDHAGRAGRSDDPRLAWRADLVQAAEAAERRGQPAHPVATRVSAC